MTSNFHPRSIPNDRIIVREMDTETLLYDERTHKAWCLNQSSACIWRLCDGKHAVSEIAEAASRELGSPVNEELVLLTVAELREKELLEEIAPALLPEGMSRRAMIGRAGLVAAALLPVIASVVAPPAAHAVSGTGGTGPTDRSHTPRAK
jgi:hypothetical protein